MHKNAWHWYFFGRFSKRWGPLPCHRWLTFKLHSAGGCNKSENTWKIVRIDAWDIFPFQQTHIFSPKKDHLFKKWDGGQLAFRASLGKSFLNFPNVFFLKSYSKPSQCLQYSQNCLIWKYLLNILTKLTRWRFRLYFSIFPIFTD